MRLRLGIPITVGAVVLALLALSTVTASAGEVASLGRVGVPSTAQQPRALANVRAAGVTAVDIGVLNYGVAREFYVPNARYAAYAIGVVAYSDDGGQCAITITRTWYIQPANAARQFRFLIKSTYGLGPCHTTLYVQGLNAYQTFSTGNLRPGQTRGWTWNNAHTESNVYQVGLTPAQTSAGACQLEVTRTWYTHAPNGEREYRYWIKNTGQVDCSGDRHLIRLPVTQRHPSELDTEHTMWTYGIDFTQGSHIFVPGIAPGRIGSTECVLQLEGWGYMSDADPSNRQMGAVVGVDNPGSADCRLTYTLSAVD